MGLEGRITVFTVVGEQHSGKCGSGDGKVMRKVTRHGDFN